MDEKNINSRNIRAVRKSIRVSVSPSPFEENETEKEEIRDAIPRGLAGGQESPKFYHLGDLKSGKAAKICEKISKIAIYLLVFLLPIFFLPWTANVLDFNKQALLLSLTFIALFFWLAKILISGKGEINLHPFSILPLVLFLVFVLATVFSLTSSGSFWGWPLHASDNLVNLLGLLLLYFLIINIFEKKEIFNILSILLVSGLLAFAFAVFQLFNKFLLPFGFTKTASFNTIGLPNGLSIFAAVLLPLITVILLRSRAALKALLIVALVAGVLVLVLVNFKVSWWLVGIGSVLLIVLGVTKRDSLGNNWLFLPMLFLVLALFFGVFRFQIPGTSSALFEVSPSYKTSLEISLKALKDGPIYRPILGTGPGTFSYDWSKYKPENVNQGVFWNLRFINSSSKIFDVVVTTGILGLIAFAAMLGTLIYLAARTILFKKGIEEEVVWLAALGIFVSFVTLALGYFLYPGNLSLDFLLFLLMAGFIALLPAKRKKLSLEGSSLTTLIATFAFILIFVLGTGVFILEGQRYLAEVRYLQGIKAWQLGNSQGALASLEKAVSLNGKSDLFLRDLSQAYLLSINPESQRKDLPQDQLNQRIQLFISRAIAVSIESVNVEPLNVANLSVRGFVYQNLIGAVKNVEEWAIKSYDEALKLEPTNPYLATQKGIVYLREALSAPENQKTQKEELLGRAKEEFQKAVGLKSDYSPAHFQLAMILQAQGKTQEAIQKLEEIKSIAPSDTGLAFQLGLIYFQNKNYEKAQAEFERAVAVDSNYSNALYFLGLTYDKLGQKSRAITQFERVVRLNPDSQEAKKILDNLKAGKPALEGIVQEVPPTVPIEEKQPEKLKSK